MAFYRKCLILALLALCLQANAQDVRFSYQSKIGTGNIDTILVWARSNTINPISLGAVNLSWVFNSSCLSYTAGGSPTPNSYWSLFRNTWGSLLDLDLLQTITVTYDGNPYDRRVQYGNAMAFFPAPIVLPTNAQAPLLVMKLWFSGSCTSQVYMEDESENGLNQIAGPTGNLLTYIIENILSQPLASIWSEVKVDLPSPEAALVSWVPTAEMTDGSFEVERSKSPNFSQKNTLNTLPLQKGPGRPYQFEDNQPIAGLSFYRIRFMASDGREELSRVVSLYLETEELKDPIRIIPNPSAGIFDLNFLLSEDPVMIQILDLHGRMVFEKRQAFQEAIPISVSFLPAGTYQLLITQEDGKRWHKQVMIR
jgi:hypothetical protein